LYFEAILDVPEGCVLVLKVSKAASLLQWVQEPSSHMMCGLRSDDSGEKEKLLNVAMFLVVHTSRTTKE
jgi:hypothetical protein